MSSVHRDSKHVIEPKDNSRGEGKSSKRRRNENTTVKNIEIKWKEENRRIRRLYRARERKKCTGFPLRELNRVLKALCNDYQVRNLA